MAVRIDEDRPVEELHAVEREILAVRTERIRRRLRQVGIRPERRRPAALLALATSVPAPILGELLGYSDDTANHWRRAAAGDLARYASLRSTSTT